MHLNFLKKASLKFKSLTNYRSNNLPQPFDTALDNSYLCIISLEQKRAIPAQAFKANKL